MEAGWHLWNVALSGQTPKLWITTATRDLTLAIRKAQTFMRNAPALRDTQIQAVNYHGTIDA